MKIRLMCGRWYELSKKEYQDIRRWVCGEDLNIDLLKIFLGKVYSFDELYVEDWEFEELCEENYKIYDTDDRIISEGYKTEGAAILRMNYLIDNGYYDYLYVDC